jgi:hypothetical protein
VFIGVSSLSIELSSYYDIQKNLSTADSTSKVQGFKVGSALEMKSQTALTLELDISDKLTGGNGRVTTE